MNEYINKLITAVLTLYLGFTIQNYFDFWNVFRSSDTKGDPYIYNNIVIFSQSQLSHYNGIFKELLYLSILGTVFDVTNGKRNYEKNAPYHYFVGKDGSRALISGDFEDESNEKDHVLDLPCEALQALMNWKKTFEEKYKVVGVLNGRYYDQYGRETVYSTKFKEKIEQCKVEKEVEHKNNEKFPPCNIAWSADEGSKVWCTKSSGGVNRGWVGVPRQLYTPGAERPKCVCVNLKRKNEGVLLKEYEDCEKLSEECKIF